MKKVLGIGLLGILAYFAYGWYTGTRAKPQVNIHDANGAADAVKSGGNQAADQVAGFSQTTWQIIMILVIVACIAAAWKVPKVRFMMIGAGLLTAAFLFFTYVVQVKTR